jgi:guanine deaminase
MAQTIRGTILQTPSPESFELLSDQILTVDDDGTIVSIVDGTRSDEDVDVELGTDMVLLPGLIDTHIHAPQWPQLGTGLDLSLEKWLFDYTFPLESRFEDLEFAEAVWSHMVPSLLSEGTTTAVYYGSVHEPATIALAETCVHHGQRAFVGRVAMDHPEGTPEWYRDQSASAAVSASQRSIEAIRALRGAPGLVEPIVTPRFIPACTDAALTGLGELAHATETRIQTHCSESDWEHGHVLDRCGRTDADALDGFGLIADHTVLAHATHLTDDDRSLLARTGAGVAHCPLSNSYFSNAVFSTRRALDAGVRVGMGTDIAGGPESSLLAQCQHAVTSSQMLETGVDVTRASNRGVGGSRIDAITAFYLATGGGADLLGIDAGLLAPGRVFDAIAVDIGEQSRVRRWDGDDWARTFEKIVRGATAGEIRHVWVAGNRVGGHRYRGHGA